MRGGETLNPKPGGGGAASRVCFDVEFRVLAAGGGGFVMLGLFGCMGFGV